MLLALVLCIVAVALLLMPDAFGALAAGAVNNPEWGIPLLAIVFLIAVWIHRQ